MAALVTRQTPDLAAPIASNPLLRSSSDESLVDAGAEGPEASKHSSNKVDNPPLPESTPAASELAPSASASSIDSTTSNTQPAKSGVNIPSSARSSASLPANRAVPAVPSRRVSTTPAKVFVPAGIAPIASKPPAIPADLAKKLRKPGKTSLPSFLALAPDSPVFTTPLLDFAAHSEELSRLASGLYRLRDHYFELYPAKPFPKENRLTFAQRCSAERNQRMRIAHKLVHDRFMLLTKPYVVRKKERGLSTDGRPGTSVSTAVSSPSRPTTAESRPTTVTVTALAIANDAPLPLGLRSASPCSSDDGTLIGDDDLEHRLHALATVPNSPTSDGSIATLHGFDSTLRSSHLAVFHYLRGHINNYFPKHSPEAERDLLAATLLQPTSYEAHIALAECVLKRGDVQCALGVAETALKVVVPRRKEILRMVAMVLRQAAGRAGLQDGGRARMEQVERALALGKEAVQMDLEDGASWFGLGMSHLNLFFNVTQDKQDLLRALKAFDKAASCKINAGASLPDLYYNRALVHQYLDEVEKSIQDFENANQLDPTAGWSGEAEGLRRMVVRIIENVSKRGHLRLTKISDLVHALRNPSQMSLALRGLKDAESKSFAEVMRSKPKKAKGIGAEPERDGKMCLRFAIIADIEHTRVVPKSFLGMDRDGVVFCVAIYSIRPDSFKVGDDVSVLDPNCRDIDVSSMSMKYPLVRIEYPVGVSVNSRPLTSSDVLQTTCTCFLPGFVDESAPSSSTAPAPTSTPSKAK